MQLGQRKTQHVFFSSHRSETCQTRCRRHKRNRAQCRNERIRVIGFDRRDPVRPEPEP